MQNIFSYLILSYLILSYLILSHLILSYLISSYLISSYLIFSSLLASFLLSVLSCSVSFSSFHEQVFYDMYLASYCPPFPSFYFLPSVPSCIFEQILPASGQQCWPSIKSHNYLLFACKRKVESNILLSHLYFSLSPFFLSFILLKKILINVFQEKNILLITYHLSLLSIPLFLFAAQLIPSYHIPVLVLLGIQVHQSK